MKETKKEVEKKSKGKKIFLGVFWGLFLVGILTAVLLFWMITKGWLGYLPDIDELQNPKNKYATEVYSADLQLLGRYFYSKDNRVGVNYADISPNVINALIATEDERFMDHSGIDGRALMRVLIKTAFLQQRSAGGGSTITQQLAKQLYSPQADNIFERALQKPNEWVIAVELERLYTKQEIITMYLNQFDFLNNAVGIKSAAQVYFNTTPANLSIEQAATLVGMCKNPSYYNPVRHNERTRERRNMVFHQMVKADFITQAECDSLQQLPLELDFHRVDHKLGLAPYFREYLRRIMTAKEPKESNYASWQQQQYLEDLDDWNNNPLYGFCNKNKKADGTPYNIYSDGLRIYTTIDSRMQQYAEEAVNEHMQELQEKFFKEKKGRSYAPFSRHLTQEEISSIMTRTKRQSERYWGMKREGATEAEIDSAFNTPVEMEVFSYNGMIDTIMSPMDSIRYHKYFLRCGMMSIDAKSGYVKAYVGGPSFEQFQYDMATRGRRQVGSTIKPYLYTLAMEEGMWPCDKTIYQPITLMDANGIPWSPRNSDSKADDLIGKEVTLQWGLTNSNNWISAYLMSLYTPESFVKLLRSFGMRGPIDPVVSLCLGPCEISVAEMVDAYTAFPNKGIRIEPLYVTRIEDRNGNVIASFTPKTHEIFSEETSYKMITMLRNVIDHGTGVRVRYRYGLEMPMGGKTGTTQNNSDGWFMGFTPSLVTGVWVGGEDRAIHFDRISDGQGASMALPIWALYMKKVLANPETGYSPMEEFDIPEDFNPNAGCQ
ncbi:MAG: transglycosylase domain-containing protein [Bacteroidetes bacterium]|uniref:Transglycosylase domain-containing protein n=1 Tax=Candidatus Gallipaludibacter merdavium TaxID=2840839 RepID=A0A9D9HSS6_9BACT|nr:transglycosylase domain-containing protein [Candidatus Gallipaludibacter merdavium]